VFIPALFLVVGATPLGSFFTPAANRTLYFKLPIEGARFHWTFLDPKAFLSGELTLRILNKGHDQTLVVFRDGKIQDGWEMIGDREPDSSFYFGFSSTHRFRTKPNDSLIITLKAPKDLVGRGPYSEGVLAAGVRQMTGTYSSLYGRRWNPMDLIVLHGEPPVAFMECWKGVWPIRTIKAEGWVGPTSSDEHGLSRRLSSMHRGTNGHKCGSHI
jgi:hypothetical protein